MVGGGSGSFIGAIHRMGAAIDGQIELVCGAFNSDPSKSKRSGHDLFLPENRCYGTYVEMMEREAELPEGQRMDFVSIVTPNHMHFDPAMLALKKRFPVILDKPLCFTMEEAHELQAMVEESGLPFALTQTYTGYPMVKQARAMVKNGEIGFVTKVMVEYPQGWLNTKLEDSDQKQAEWRANPKKAGKSNCFGDIGTHAANLAEYVSGLKIEQVLAELRKVVKGRTLDDDANVLLHFERGATGALYASQVASGYENDLKIRISGDLGGLEWANRDPNTLLVFKNGQPEQVYRAGGNNGYLSEVALMHCRTPAGHPEGYIEAFANIYRNYAFALREHLFGYKGSRKEMDFAGIQDGVRGMALIDAVVESSAKGGVWSKVKV